MTVCGMTIVRDHRTKARRSQNRECPRGAALPAAPRPPRPAGRTTVFRLSGDRRPPAIPCVPRFQQGYGVMPRASGGRLPEICLGAASLALAAFVFFETAGYDSIAALAPELFAGILAVCGLLLFVPLATSIMIAVGTL